MSLCTYISYIYRARKISTCSIDWFNRKSPNKTRSIEQILLMAVIFSWRQATLSLAKTSNFSWRLYCYQQCSRYRISFDWNATISLLLFVSIVYITTTSLNIWATCWLDFVTLYVLLSTLKITKLFSLFIDFCAKPTIKHSFHLNSLKNPIEFGY